MAPLGRDRRGLNPFRPARRYVRFDVALLLAVASIGASAEGAAQNPPNPVVLENSREGTAGWADSLSGSTTVEGYTSEVSVLPGETVHFHVASERTGPYTVDVYRLGWYGGLGARLVASFGGTAQPQPRSSAATGAGWPVTSELPVPEDWVSGYYLARFHGGGRGVGATIFVVRALSSRPGSDSRRGSGQHVAGVQPMGRKEPVRRQQRGGSGRPRFVRAAVRARPTFSRSSGRCTFVRFLEREGYDVAYQTDVDTHRDPASLLRSSARDRRRPRRVLVEPNARRLRAGAGRRDEHRVLRCERRLLADSLREPGTHDRRLQVSGRPGARPDAANACCSGSSAGPSASSSGSCSKVA